MDVTFVETELLMSLTVAHPARASVIDNKTIIAILFIACPPIVLMVGKITRT